MANPRTPTLRPANAPPERTSERRVLRLEEAAAGVLRIVGADQSEDSTPTFLARLRDGDVDRVATVHRVPSALFASRGDDVERDLVRAATIDAPNLCKILALGRRGSSFLVAYEHVFGATLDVVADRLAERGAPERWSALASYVVAHACRAVSAAHRSGMAHGCVTPRAISVTFSGEVVVGDLGWYDPMRVQHDAWALGYSAPELLERGRQPTAASDVWSLGVVLWELLTLRRLFPHDYGGALLAVTVGRIPAPSEYTPNLPRALDLVVQRALSREPHDRFERVEEMGAQLTAALLSDGPVWNTHLTTLMHEALPGAERRRRAELDRVLRRRPARANALVTDETLGVVRSEPSRGVAHRAAAIGMATLALGGAAAAWWMLRPAPTGEASTASDPGAFPVMAPVGERPRVDAAPEVPPPVDTARNEDLPRPEEYGDRRRRSPTGTSRAARSSERPTKGVAESTPAPPDAGVTIASATPPPVDAAPVPPPPDVDPAPVQPPPQEKPLEEAPARPRVEPPPPVARPAPATAMAIDASFGKLLVDGSLSRGDVSRTVSRAIGDLASCARASGRVVVGQIATVSVSFEIDDSGAIRGVSTSGDDKALRSCVSRALSKLRSRAVPDVGEVRVTTTVSFRAR